MTWVWSQLFGGRGGLRTSSGLMIYSISAINWTTHLLQQGALVVWWQRLLNSWQTSLSPLLEGIPSLVYQNLKRTLTESLESQGHIPRLTIAHFKMPAWGTPGWKKNEFLICHIAKYNAYVFQHLMDGKSLSSVSTTYQNCMSFP